MFVVPDLVVQPPGWPPARPAVGARGVTKVPRVGATGSQGAHQVLRRWLAQFQTYLGQSSKHWDVLESMISATSSLRSGVTPRNRRLTAISGLRPGSQDAV